MMHPEVVEYLRENLPKFPVDDLRRQLREEGVSDLDFEQCLAEALRSPKLTQNTRRIQPASKAAKSMLASGVLLILLVGLYALSLKPATPRAGRADAATATGESGFVGAHGWVVRLPKDYVGLSEFKDSSKRVEIVHFCKRGTDPTNFLNEGLFGEMGIVRHTVAPSDFPANPTGAASLADAVARRTAGHGEKFVLKNIQVGALSGVQVNVQSPFPRVEAYVLGQSDVYFFYASLEDDIWRDIVPSLRDARSEN